MMNVRTNFLHYLFRLRAVAIFALAIIFSASVFADQKLKVFILAGQSNTVGHARGHTITTLYKNGMTKDKDLVRMVFSKDMSKEFEEQLIKARKLDELSGGIGFPKIKNMPDGPEKESLETQVNKLVAEHESYKKTMIDACEVSDRVYISSIADRNLKSGKLGVGYGADDIKIGPEYGFGLSMAQKIKGPILLIKASWGGKSLMYDFRPPSASDFKNTKAYADAKTKAEENLVKYKEAIKNFPETENKYAADLAAYREKMKTADEKTKKKLPEPRKPKLPREPKPFSQDDAGHFWREMVKHVNGVLTDPRKYHPNYDAELGYEIAGFVWFQGFNDQFNPEYHGNYADNMKTFIKDVRTSFKTPNMPFVIGVLGTPRTKEKVDENAVSIAQREAAKHPEFIGNVLSVESYKDYSNFSHSVFEKGWPPHYHEWSTVGSDRPYHYLGSGAFFVRLGNSFANAMHQLMNPHN
ncbi:sialate O-acetylesterase [Opitutales bacterium]|nr:sialate O-acetylesterase [Opitutales bacterium]